MATWLTSAFKAIPWREVFTNAPRLLDGANKLLGMVRRNDPPHVQIPDSLHTEQIADLASQVESLEITVNRLKEETTEASGLISSLAEQSAQLVIEIDLLRRRAGVLAILSTILGLAVTAIIIAMILQRA